MLSSYCDLPKEPGIKEGLGDEHQAAGERKGDPRGIYGPFRADLGSVSGQAEGLDRVNGEEQLSGRPGLV